jgi:hypothetical protein
MRKRVMGQADAVTGARPVDLVDQQVNFAFPGTVRDANA